MRRRRNRPPGFAARRSTFSSITPSGCRHAVAQPDLAFEHDRAGRRRKPVAILAERRQCEFASQPRVGHVEQSTPRPFRRPRHSRRSRTGPASTVAWPFWLANQNPAIGEVFRLARRYTTAGCRPRAKRPCASAAAPFRRSPPSSFRTATTLRERMFFDAFGLSSSTWIIRFASYTGLATSAYSTASQGDEQR